MFALSFESWISVIQKIVENEDPLCGILFLHIKELHSIFRRKKKNYLALRPSFSTQEQKSSMVHMMEGRTQSTLINSQLTETFAPKGCLIQSVGVDFFSHTRQIMPSCLILSLLTQLRKTWLKTKIQPDKRQTQIEQYHILGKEYQHTLY